jgi:hypothetical protein
MGHDDTRGGQALGAAKSLGLAATESGWRKKLADATAPRAAAVTPARADQVRAILGVVLFAISLTYVLRTLSRTRTLTEF